MVSIIGLFVNFCPKFRIPLGNFEQQVEKTDDVTPRLGVVKDRYGIFRWLLLDHSPIFTGRPLRLTYASGQVGA